MSTNNQSVIAEGEFLKRAMDRYEQIISQGFGVQTEVATLEILICQYLQAERLAKK